MIAGLAISFLLPVIDLHPLRKGPVAEEIGRELEAELAQAERRDEPEL